MERLIAATPLRGSNGITVGPDGRIWVAEYLPGRISAVDVATGDVEVIVAPDGPLHSPDDLVFDTAGTLYITDVAPGRVWRRSPSGDLTVAADGIHNPNGIAAIGDRIFVNEMIPGGRLLELTATPTVLTEGLMLGNAMQAGPDGDLYYPHMFPGEVYRISPDGGTPSLVAEVAQTVAVRFDRTGVLYVLSIDEAGTITRIDGDQRTEIVTGIAGLDNAAFDAANRMYVSSFSSGGITEVRPDGTLREIVPRGLAGPYGIAVDARGDLHVADHYRIDGAFLPFAHAIAASGDDLHFTSQYGQVLTRSRTETRTRAENLDQPQGITVRPDGTLLVAEAGAGRVLAIAPDDEVTVAAEGLTRPVDVAVDADGRCYVSDEAQGTVYRVDDGKPTIVADGLHAPQGLTVTADGRLLVVEATHRRVVEAGPQPRVIASNLPVAVPRPTQPALLIAGLPGVPRQFAALTTAPDGTILLGASADGSVLRLTP
ncbi:SMP-30/gluconolactonase/LRE family protein [Actinoplanes philippinensis]|uniref:SMP-30/gluconolactonase/LRE family protein n=1 Tax=Actinoplanes philippinensis TaxID=35752 RepID=UPI0033F4E145